MNTKLKIAAGLALLALVPTAAMAHTDLSIGLNLGGGGYYEPAPVYVAPAPAYYSYDRYYYRGGDRYYYPPVRYGYRDGYYRDRDWHDHDGHGDWHGDHRNDWDHGRRY